LLKKLGIDPARAESNAPFPATTVEHDAPTAIRETSVIANSTLALAHDSYYTGAVYGHELINHALAVRNQHIVQSNKAQEYFPLSRDHELLTLITHNVCRGILTNTSILAKAPSTAFAAKSCCEGLYTFDLSIVGFEFPPMLKPTALQGQVPHLPWIDLFPSPSLRDNLISAFMQSRINLDELVMDLIGNLFQSGEGMAEQQGSNEIIHVASDVHELGLISWADPWDINGWEVTEAFVRKWGALLRGCGDVITATNNWRRLRGEAELAVNI
jgi:hypothetical protein